MWVFYWLVHPCECFSDETLSVFVSLPRYLILRPHPAGREDAEELSEWQCPKCQPVQKPVAAAPAKRSHKAKPKAPAGSSKAASGSSKKKSSASKSSSGSKRKASSSSSLSGKSGKSSKKGSDAANGKRQRKIKYECCFSLAFSCSSYVMYFSNFPSFVFSIVATECRATLSIRTMLFPAAAIRPLRLRPPPPTATATTTATATATTTAVLIPTMASWPCRWPR